MNDDRVIRVLEEIRELQREHAERYAVVLIMAVGVLLLLLMRVVARLP